MKLHKMFVVAFLVIFLNSLVGTVALAADVVVEDTTLVDETVVDETVVDETVVEETMVEESVVSDENAEPTLINEDVSEYPFSDVDNNNVNFKAISYVYENGIVEGYEDGTYKPDQKINRAEFTKILVGAAFAYDPAKDEAEYDINSLEGLSFSDIEDQAWYVPFLRQAVENMVIEGYPDGTFKPEQNVNFVEAAKIIVTSFGHSYDVDPDVWYKGYVDALSKRRAIPVTINSFDQEITRGEMAEMVYRIKAIVADQSTMTYEELDAVNHIGEENGEVVISDVENKVSLYFGNASDNTAVDSYPVYVLDCFEMGCEAVQYAEDEWTLNTNDRFGFDVVRNAIYYSKEVNGSTHIYKFNVDTNVSTSIGIENDYDKSYRPHINGDTMGMTLIKGDKVNVFKYNLLTKEVSEVEAFNEYDECDWASVNTDESIYAICKNEVKGEYSVVGEDGKVYYNSPTRLASLIVTEEGITYFVEEGYVKVLDMASLFVRGSDVIPPFQILYAMTISPDGNYLGGFGEVSGEWVVGIYDRRTGVLTMPVQVVREPGIPSFGPYIDTIDRTTKVTETTEVTEPVEVVETDETVEITE